MSRKDVKHVSFDETDNKKFDTSPMPTKPRYLGKKSRRVNKNLSAQKRRATKR